nr:MAG TPA: hypothetical protein [Caudoviricetes sp.]
MSGRFPFLFPSSCFEVSGTFPPGTYIYYVYIFGMGREGAGTPFKVWGRLKYAPHTQEGAHPSTKKKWEIKII